MASRHVACSYDAMRGQWGRQNLRRVLIPASQRSELCQEPGHTTGLFSRHGLRPRLAYQCNVKSTNLSMIKAIRRQRRQAGVLHMASGREVVERLKRHVIEPHDLMHRVIKKTADSGSPNASRLRF